MPNLTQPEGSQSGLKRRVGVRWSQDHCYCRPWGAKPGPGRTPTAPPEMRGAESSESSGNNSCQTLIGRQHVSASLHLLRVQQAIWRSEQALGRRQGNMKVLFWVGLVVLVLGAASLFVPFPSREHHGIKVGGAEVGIETQSSAKVSPILSGVLIGAGALMMLGGRRSSQA
jgi:hypothetical protein